MVVAITIRTNLFGLGSLTDLAAKLYVLNETATKNKMPIMVTLGVNKGAPAKYMTAQSDKADKIRRVGKFIFIFWMNRCIFYRARK